MPMKLQVAKLEELMTSFYTLTNIKIVIFDENYDEIISYPKNHCELCALMQSHEKTKIQCIKSNIYSFETCKKTKELLIYHCHAGLVEATSPLLNNGVIIGYIMFGQITDNKNKYEFINKVSQICEKYNLLDTDYIRAIKNVKYKNHKQIRSSAKILEACTYYLLLNQLVFVEKEYFINQLDEFIDSNISRDISINSLCQEFNLSRTKIYSLSSSLLSVGIAEYIKDKRIEKAKNLLKSSNFTITEISGMVGFPDYNYFCRVFKKQTGIPAKSYRQSSTLL